MYEKMHFHIRGVLPSLQHHGRLKNPLDPYAKWIRKHSKKSAKEKTDEDHVQMMEAEFKGSLYCLDDQKGTGIHWPADNVHAMIKIQAKKKSWGKKIDSGVVVQHPCEFIFEGPKSRDARWKDESCRLVKATRRGTMCCRPMFAAGWECKVDLRFLPEVISGEDLQQVVVDAGKYLGLTDWPRRYGLFKVLEFKEEWVNAEEIS